MKTNISACLFFLFSITGVNTYGQKVDKKQSFDSHFKILDSLASTTKGDTIYTGRYVESISFMEKHTKIHSSTSGNFYGRLGFTKENLRMWHEWYDRRYRKK